MKNLLEEAREFLPVKPSDKLRLVEMAAYKINRIVPNGTSLDTLVQQAPKSWRIEVVSLFFQLLQIFSIL